MSAHTIQLNPPIPVTTEHGEGYAMLYTDYGPLENACWTIARRSDGMIRHYNTAQVKLSTNYTYRINTKEEKKK